MSEKISPPATRRAAFILALWAERPASAPPVWRGYLETADGRRRYFRSLADLNQLLRAASGWSDPVETSPGDHS
jgi:hypothetical protein